MRQRVFVWDDFELNYNQSTIVFTKVRTSFACNEFLCDRNDQIESAVHEGFHHSSLPLWISSFGKPLCEGAGMMGQKMFLFTIVCVSSIDFMRQCFCDVFVLVSFGSHAKRELEVGSGKKTSTNVQPGAIFMLEAHIQQN